MILSRFTVKLGKRHWALMVALMLLCCLVMPQWASAHAYIVQASPGEDELVATAPEQLTLEFNESLQTAFFDIKITAPDGTQADDGNVHVDEARPHILETGLRTGLGNGTYAVNWKAVSADGHPIQGAYVFHIGEPSGAPAGLADLTSGTGQVGGPLKWILSLTDWIQYLGLSVILGTLAFLLLRIAPASMAREPLEVPRSYRLLWISYGAASVAALISLPLNTLYESGVSIGEFSWALMGSALKLTSFGQIWMVQILIVMLLAVTILSGYDRDRSLRIRIWSSYGSLVLVLGWLFTHAMTGHPAAAEQRALAIAMDFVHLIGAAFWIGALTAMAVCLPPLADKLPSTVRGEVYWTAIRRFTAWGIGAVAALVATGIYSSLIILPAPLLTSLFTTAYGLVLIAKVVLLVVMLVLAWRHARMARASSGNRLAGSLKAELIAGAVVLALAAVLTHLSPGQPTAAGPYKEAQTMDDGTTITLQVSPNRTGENQFKVDVKKPDGTTVNDLEQITLSLTHLDMDMGIYEITIPKNDTGVYEAEEYISMPGRWNIKVHLLTRSLDSLDTEFEIDTANP
ncbi:MULTISPECIES: copper resistance CopC/CopD family protein [Paenibacillus]|uniref:Copper transport protein n=1 Tax=Paenibacillus pabuli TaxID=1472 RepID=A0A855YF62_9BACL|nr:MULTISPECIES: copper resistance protein CopC [Paenibacillus]PWW42282.1 copper transport protein [Paenibacillus pabuli]PXW07670.1 copper transport protein [Paenibacillus taichungensis]